MKEWFSETGHQAGQDRVPWEGNKGGIPMITQFTPGQFSGCQNMELEEGPIRKLVASLGWGNGAGSSTGQGAARESTREESCRESSSDLHMPAQEETWVWGKDTQKEHRHNRWGSHEPWTGRVPSSQNHWVEYAEGKVSPRGLLWSSQTKLKK